MIRMRRELRRFVLGLWVLALGPTAALALDADTPLNSWLLRVHNASKQRTYTGTFVVSSGGNFASAKIWHVCDGAQQVERVEPLTGVPRATYRRNDRVVTLYPASKVAVIETRESLGLFPGLLKSTDANIAENYQFKDLGAERMAGFDADGIGLTPKDAWRYGYRVWSEKRTGLVIQLQTLDATGRVIEQSAFSELQLDAPVKMAQLVQQMENTKGYSVSRPTLRAVTPQSMGWRLMVPVAGFRQVGCFSRPITNTEGQPASSAAMMQWIFTDGLATLSLFVENFDLQSHQREGAIDTGGATHIVTRRLADWWVTAVGEVPAPTLRAFVAALERNK
ncbi:MAG: transcriptional regulator [Burkholderiales bacterium PBB3]|nr:MAG: transcriptional regulator [Burkholderiales bacterium PBB3]